MPHGRLPLVPVVHGGYAVQFNTLSIDCHPQHGHVVFPADHRANFPDGGIGHRQSRAVAKPPDQTLRCGGHQFAVLARHLTVRGEYQRRTIQGPALPFDHTDYDMESGRGHLLGETFHPRAGNFDGAFYILPVLLPAFKGAHSHNRSEMRSLGVPADKRFGKYDNIRTFSRGFFNKRRCMGRRRLRVIHHKTILDHCRTNLPGHPSPHALAVAMCLGHTFLDELVSLPKRDKFRYKKTPSNVAVL